jgi:hypothetical protein
MEQEKAMNSIEDIKELFDSDNDFDEELAEFLDKKTKLRVKQDDSTCTTILKYTSLSLKLLIIFVTKSTVVTVFYAKKLFKNTISFLYNKFLRAFS